MDQPERESPPTHSLRRKNDSNSLLWPHLQPNENLNDQLPISLTPTPLVSEPKHKNSLSFDRNFLVQRAAKQRNFFKQLFPETIKNGRPLSTSPNPLNDPDFLCISLFFFLRFSNHDQIDQSIRHLGPPSKKLQFKKQKVSWKLAFEKTLMAKKDSLASSSPLREEEKPKEQESPEDQQLRRLIEKFEEEKEAIEAINRIIMKTGVLRNFINKKTKRKSALLDFIGTLAKLAHVDSEKVKEKLLKRQSASCHLEFFGKSAETSEKTSKTSLKKTNRKRCPWRIPNIMTFGPLGDHNNSVSIKRHWEARSTGKENKFRGFNRVNTVIWLPENQEEFGMKMRNSFSQNGKNAKKGKSPLFELDIEDISSPFEANEIFLQKNKRKSSAQEGKFGRKSSKLFYFFTIHPLKKRQPGLKEAQKEKNIKETPKTEENLQRSQQKELLEENPMPIFSLIQPGNQTPGTFLGNIEEIPQESFCQNGSRTSIVDTQQPKPLNRSSIKSNQSDTKASLALKLLPKKQKYYLEKAKTTPDSKHRLSISEKNSSGSFVSGLSLTIRRSSFILNSIELEKQTKNIVRIGQPHQPKVETKMKISSFETNRDDEKLVLKAKNESARILRAEFKKQKEKTKEKEENKHKIKRDENAKTRKKDQKTKRTSCKLEKSQRSFLRERKEENFIREMSQNRLLNCLNLEETKEKEATHKKVFGKIETGASFSKFRVVKRQGNSGTKTPEMRMRKLVFSTSKDKKEKAKETKEEKRGSVIKIQKDLI